MTPEERRGLTMSKQLNIDYFSDGLSEVEFNCLDIPIAAACGYYKKENYFLYLLQICINANWNKKENYSNTGFSEDIFKNIGLKIKKIHIHDKNNLINTINVQIENDFSVLLPVSYYEMFFCSRYKRNNESHFILVNGYIRENEIILLREEINFISSEDLKNVKGLYPLRLKEKMVEDMWELSNKIIHEKLRNKIYIIKEINSSKLKNLKDFIKYFIDSYNMEESLMISKMKKFACIDKKYFERFMIELRSDCKYMYAFFSL